MQYDEKLVLLKAMPLFAKIPPRQLAGLIEFLRPREFADGAAVFEEGSEGLSLYIIARGRVRIAKRAADKTARDLAVLSSGEFFGEMAMAEEAVRSASAIASGPCLLLELFRGDLGRWIKLNPEQAVQFFVGLTHVQSNRLRKTSNELALQFELSDFLFEEKDDASGFLDRVLASVALRLEGSWSAAAYLDGALAATHGTLAFPKETLSAAPQAGFAAQWKDDLSVEVPLLGRRGNLGHLLFRHPFPVDAAQREGLSRLLTTVARQLSAALELRRLIDEPERK